MLFMELIATKLTGRYTHFTLITRFACVAFSDWLHELFREVCNAPPPHYSSESACNCAVNAMST